MDGENYKSQELSIKQLVLEQYRRCLALGSQNILNDSVQREQYINAVRVMEMVVLPEFVGDYYNELKKNFRENEEQITELEQELKLKVSEFQRKEQNINSQLLQNTYERRLVALFHKKLVNIGLLLKKKNYYDEETYIDNYET